MQLIVQGRNFDINDWTREYIEKKIEKLERFLPELGDVRAELGFNATRAENDRFKAQITMWADGQILRSEESTGDIFVSIDNATDKLRRQIKRFKGRRYESKRRESAQTSEELELAAAAVVAEEIDTAEESTGQIIRRKFFKVEPLTEEEAVIQMELLDHNFYIFYNSDQTAVNVLYRRDDGHYGILQPDFV